MPGWTLVDTHPVRGRTFRRPVAPSELSFIWDGRFNGTCDCLHHYELSLKNGPQDAHLFSEINITRAWISTKRRFPLVGAVVRGADGGRLRIKTAAMDPAMLAGFDSEPHFVVHERDLATIHPGEIVLGHVDCSEELQQQVVTIAHGPRSLSEELLAKLYVFRETDPKRSDIFHFMILIAHCVTDGTANRTFARCLLDALARGGGLEPAQIPLEERLAMAIPPINLEPEHLRSLSQPIRRWRRAVAMVILQLRVAKMQGGHTLPCRLTRSTPHTASHPGLVSTSLTPTQTTTVIANCRAHNLTFGNAFTALAQVAMTRVLYRRYLRGEISEEEWTYRKRQPHINVGPLSLRPYLDKTWLHKGGGGELVPCINLFICQLPFMTLGTTAMGQQKVFSDGSPPFSDLLTFDRFLHRAMLVKKQTAAYFNHPLLLEIAYAGHLAYVKPTQLRALEWMQCSGTGTLGDSDKDKVLEVMDIPMICAHGGSSVGDLNLISPAEYPLSSAHPLSPYSSTPHPLNAGYVIPPSLSPPVSEDDMVPKIVVENLTTHMRTSPAELYLGAATARGRMSLYVYYDRNVFEDGVVKEWLDEVREAVLWYLGRTHQSRRTRQGRNNAVYGQTERVRTKL